MLGLYTKNPEFYRKFFPVTYFVQVEHLEKLSEIFLKYFNIKIILEEAKKIIFIIYKIKSFYLFHESKKVYINFSQYLKFLKAEENLIIQKDL